jgi:hypothetical protein
LRRSSVQVDFYAPQLSIAKDDDPTAQKSFVVDRFLGTIQTCITAGSECLKFENLIVDFDAAMADKSAIRGPFTALLTKRNTPSRLLPFADKYSVDSDS